MAQPLIGTSGWNYKSWRERFYPRDLPISSWLEFYADRFGAVEVNNTFYRLPEKKVFESWRNQTPASFKFVVKVSRFVTHMKKLIDAPEHVATLLERARGLGPKLDVVLFQLPPFLKFYPGRLRSLCEYVQNQSLVPSLRAALEVRNNSWFSPECVEILSSFNMALAFTDWPTLRVTGPVTADFIFVRRHGPQRSYSSDYSDEQLRQDARILEDALHRGLDARIFFNNDVEGFAVKNALSLQRMVETASRTRTESPALV